MEPMYDPGKHLIPGQSGPGVHYIVANAAVASRFAIVSEKENGNGGPR